MFLGFCFALSLLLAALYGFLVFFVDFFQQKGFERASVLLLYSGINIVSTIFRFVPGIISQSPKMPKLAIPVVYAFLGCLSLSLLLFMASYSLNAVVIALYGLAHGGMFDVMYITTLELVGKETYPTRLGIVLAAIGIANIVGTPIGGKYMEHLHIYFI